MPLYEVRLESQTDSHWRSMTVDAPSEPVARALAVRQEQELVAFSLTPAEPVEPKAPAKAEQDVEVLTRYLNAKDAYDRELEEHPARAAAAGEALKKLEAEHAIDDDGHVTGPTARGRAHLHAHYQAKPYKVVSITPVEPSADQLVRAAIALQANPKAWKRVLDRLRDENIPLGVVTASLFGLTWQKQLDGSSVSVWSSATVKTALTTSAWTPDQDTHDFFNDVTNEITGTGYTAGGATLGSKTSTYDTATDQVRLDAADTTWPSSTLTARRAVVWVDTAGASTTDPVLGWVDFGADFSTTNGTFAITWDPTGIVVFDVT